MISRLLAIALGAAVAEAQCPGAGISQYLVRILGFAHAGSQHRVLPVGRVLAVVLGECPYAEGPSALGLPADDLWTVWGRRDVVVCGCGGHWPVSMLAGSWGLLAACAGFARRGATERFVSEVMCGCGHGA